MKKTVECKGAYYTLDLNEAIQEYRADFPDYAEYVDKCADEIEAALGMGESLFAYPEGNVMVHAYASAKYISITCARFVDEVA